MHDLLTKTQPLIEAVISLIVTSLLDTAHSTARTAAASLAFNLARLHYHTIMPNSTIQGNDSTTNAASAGGGLDNESATTLVAALVEGTARELDIAEADRSENALVGLVLAMALILYRAPLDCEVMEVCRAMELSGLVGRWAAERQRGKKDGGQKGRGIEGATRLLSDGLKGR